MVFGMLDNNVAWNSIVYVYECRRRAWPEKDFPDRRHYHVHRGAHAGVRLHSFANDYCTRDNRFVVLTKFMSHLKPYAGLGNG